MRSEIDDSLLFEELSSHVRLNNNPVPTTSIGKYLFENGYFLAALAVLKARLHSSPFLLNYLMIYFATNFEIVDNAFEFK